MIPVLEDKYGLYLGIKPDFLDNFKRKENNPNYDVYDTKDGYNRFIAGKCSRLPDDEDLASGRYGINFYRAKPDFQQAVLYNTAMKDPIQVLKWLSNYAFAAATESEYSRKAKAWDDFYSHTWEANPPTLWMAPHAGTADRLPDALFPFPQLEMDGYAGRIAALCALKNNAISSKKIVMAIHSYNWFSAVFDLGSFGVMSDEKLNEVAATIEKKYHRTVQFLAGECKRHYRDTYMRWLEEIDEVRGTLEPRELEHVSLLDMFTVLTIIRGLALYGKTITDFTLDGFNKALRSLDDIEMKVVSNGHIYPAKNIANLLKIKDKIEQGRIQGILQVECMKFYAREAPELLSEIILDIKRELFE